MMPCKPTAALMKPIATKVSVSVQAGSPRDSATLGWFPFHAAMEAAIVKSVWMNVPRKSHSLVLFPILSPRRPMEEPARKVRRDVRA